MRLVAPIAAILLSTPAYAGGIGPMVVGGFHTEPLYFYSAEADGGDGPRFANPADYEQYKSSQLIGSIGSGLELVLGDRDDFIQGVFRFYWQLDTPQIDPAQTSDLVDADAMIATWRETARHIGVGSVGLQWGIVRAANDKFKFGLSAHVGTGFLTTDHTEFLLVQGGANVNYQIIPTLEAYLDVTYGVRIRKNASHGAYGTAGLRILFD
jgi:hypothetical protein